MKKWKMASFVSRSLLVFALVLSASFSGRAQVTCPFPVMNTYAPSGCDVIIDYVLRDIGGFPCGSGSGVTVPAGSSISIGCGACVVYNVDIIITSIGGVAITPPVTIDSNNPNGSVTCPACCGSLVNYTFTWSQTAGALFN